MLGITDLAGIQPLNDTAEIIVCDPGSSHGNYTLRKKKRKGCLIDINITRAKYMTPKKKILHKALVDMKKTISVMSKRHLSTKQRLKKSEKFIKEHNLMFNNMSDITKKFFECQMKTQRLHPRGRRFSLDDKMFALSLYKVSAKAYRLMSRVFALPSRKTLSDLLHAIALQPGINSQLIEHLKLTVSGITELDKTCVLLFDEISLSAGVQYSKAEDKIIGVEDLGRNIRRVKMSDKALTFVIRGVKRKFKQPIAYYFIESGIKTTDLVVALKEVICAVQSTGLNIVCTVCDQAPTNVAAINILLRETQQHYVKKNIDKRSFGFEINNQEIVPLYDPPHLLKGIRNNLITKDLSYTMNGTRRTAKWKHIVDFYEIDKCRLDIGERMVPKLTDSHIYPDKLR